MGRQLRNALDDVIFNNKQAIHVIIEIFIRLVNV
jgi:hypothetical protein